MRRPIVVGDHKFGIVPMTGGVRLVGTVEFGGLDLAPDWRRADMPAKLARPFVLGSISTARSAGWDTGRPCQTVFPSSGARRVNRMSI